MRTTAALAALLTVAGLTAPSAAAEPAVASTTAACGTTAAQWLGQFSGHSVHEYPDETVQTPITVKFDVNPTLGATTTWSTTAFPRSTDVTLSGGDIRWRATKIIDNINYITLIFQSTSVTCGADGRVTKLSGTETFYCCGGSTDPDPFSLVRTG